MIPTEKEYLAAKEICNRYLKEKNKSKWYNFPEGRYHKNILFRSLRKLDYDIEMGMRLPMEFRVPDVLYKELTPSEKELVDRVIKELSWKGTKIKHVSWT